MATPKATKAKQHQDYGSTTPVPLIFTHCHQFWSEVRWQGKCTTPVGHNMNIENALHLLNTIQTYYRCLYGWNGERYCGLTIKWDYEGRKVHLLMPMYIQKGINVSSTPHPKSNRTSHTPTSRRHMVQKSNLGNQLTKHLY
jgi:hypothetical protein